MIFFLFRVFSMLFEQKIPIIYDLGTFANAQQKERFALGLTVLFVSTSFMGRSSHDQTFSVLALNCNTSSWVMPCSE